MIQITKSICLKVDLQLQSSYKLCTFEKEEKSEIESAFNLNDQITALT